MIRTQVYLTEKEQAGLRDLSLVLKRSQSELLRLAVDELVARHSEVTQKALLLEAAGSWKENDLDLYKVRKSWNRSF